VTHRSRLFAAAALAVGFAVVAAPTATPADLPKDAAKAAVAADVAALQKKLEELSATPKPGIARTARGLALTLISYGDDATKAQAAKVLVGLKGKDFKAGIDAGKGLASPKADPGALKGVEGAYDLEDVMSPFRIARSGGMNMEKDIKDAIKGNKLDAKEAVVIGARSVALAEYSDKLTYESANSNPSMNDKSERWAKDMGTAGKELCDAGGKNDAKAVMAAIRKLDASCSNCHNDFRNE
jgi:hypothetical protein